MKIFSSQAKTPPEPQVASNSSSISQAFCDEYHLICVRMEKYFLNVESFFLWYFENPI